MNKEQKFEFVKEWKEEIKDIPYAILIDYRGLTVAQATDLRTKVRSANSILKVVKNNLAVRAIPGTQLAMLDKHFSGPCAVAYSKDDPVALAKVLADFSKEIPALEIKAAVVDGQLLDEMQVKQLAGLPGREDLLAKLAYLLNSPIQGFATVLNNMVRNLAVVLDQVAQSRE